VTLTLDLLAMQVLDEDSSVLSDARIQKTCLRRQIRSRRYAVPCEMLLPTCDIRYNKFARWCNDRHGANYRVFQQASLALGQSSGSGIRTM